MCRRKEVSKGKSNPDIILRQPCRYYWLGTCTRSPCEYWHPPECQFYKTETRCKAGDKCLFPHQKVDEQPSKKPKKLSKRKKRRQECCSCCENCTTIGLRLAKTRSYWVLTETDRPGETRCKKSWDQVEEYDSLSLRYVKQVPGKIKDHRFEKYKSKFLISEVPTPKTLEDRSQEETDRQERCARSKVWNLKTKLHSIRLPISGLCRPHPP